MHIRAYTLPIAVFFLTVFIFVWIAASVETGGWVASADGLIGTWLHAQASPPITKVMVAISFLGAPSTLTVVSVIVCVVLARYHRYDLLIVVLILVLGGNLLNYGLKFLLHRGRPVFEDPLLILSSYSFPSGHAMASTVFYGFVMGCVLSARQRFAGAAIAGGILMIALVGFSRVYLGAHYVSDVLAGTLEAIAWSTLVLALWHYPHRLSQGPGLSRRRT